MFRYWHVLGGALRASDFEIESNALFLTHEKSREIISRGLIFSERFKRSLHRKRFVDHNIGGCANRLFRDDRI